MKGFVIFSTNIPIICDHCISGLKITFSLPVLLIIFASLFMKVVFPFKKYSDTYNYTINLIPRTIMHNIDCDASYKSIYY